MMNWVCPMVCPPNNNMVTQGLMAANRSQGVQDLSTLPITKPGKFAVESLKIEVTEQKVVEKIAKVPSDDSIHMSVHLAPPGSSKKFATGDEAVGNIKQEDKKDVDEDTDSEDTI